VSTRGGAVSLFIAIGCSATGDGCATIGGGFIRGFVKALTPTYDTEIASRAAIPIPIGFSFRASQNGGSSSTSTGIFGVTGTFGPGMTFGVTGAGFSTGGGLIAGFATAFFSSRVLATLGGTTGASFSGSLTVSCLFCSIGASGLSFGGASTGLGTISGAGFAGDIGGSILRLDSTLASVTAGTAGSITRFDSTLASDAAGTGSFGEAGGTCVGGDAGTTGGITGTAGGTGFATAGIGVGVDTVGGFQERTLAGVRSTGATGGVASGETVELPGRSVNPAEACPGSR
jgi:hypothetical protein